MLESRTMCHLFGKKAGIWVAARLTEARRREFGGLDPSEIGHSL
jgi:hypothetical protein